MTHRTLLYSLAAITLLACTESDTLVSGDQRGESDFDSPVPAGARFVEHLGPHSVLGADSGEVIISFEGFPSASMLPEEAYASQGVHVVGAMIFNVPNYNWFWYPPHSGIAVVSAPLEGPDGNALLTLRFDSLWNRVSAFVTGRQAVTLTCVTPGGRMVGASTHLAPNLEDNGEWSLHPSNQEIAVEGDSIVSCTLVGDRNGFSVDDVTLRRSKPTLKMSVMATRTEVRPVTIPGTIFNAVSQVAFDSIRQGPPGAYSTPAANRTDSLLLTVRLHGGDSASRQGSVTFLLASLDSTGGHRHDAGNRPRGTLFPVDANVTTGQGARDSLVVQTDDSGKGRVIFRSSGVSGREVIRVRGVSMGDSATDSVVVTVAVSGLAFIGETENLDTIGVRPWHPEVHWGTAGTNSALRALADSLAARRKILDSLGIILASDRFPAKLAVNDMSLENGGLLDLQQDWANPHKTHRAGRDADIDVRRGTEDDRYDYWVRYYWVTIMRHRINNERQSLNHQHLTYNEP